MGWGRWGGRDAGMHLGTQKKGANSPPPPPPPFGKRGPAGLSEGQRPEREYQRREALLGGSGGMPPWKILGKRSLIRPFWGHICNEIEQSK